MKGITAYQLEILQRVSEISAGTEKLADFDQVLEKLSWKPSKDSAQFTIRACVTKGFLEKAPLEHRRGRKRVCYQLTEKGKQVLDPRVETVEEKVTVFVPGVDDDSGFEDMEVIES